MTGLVVVSHSRALADAAVALATEMLSGATVPVEVAAGLDDGAFGTDAVAIAEAIGRAGAGGGDVVVLMDLGSAVLSAELALELLDPDGVSPDDVVLCPAPIVEGLVVAAVSAAGGATAAEVAAEARNSLLAKESQLGGADAPAVVESEDPREWVTGRFVVSAEHGLHARPAAALVRLVAEADASVEFRNATTGSGWVPGASLSRVATLGAVQGHEIEIRASGPDAADIVSRVKALAARDLGESAGSGTAVAASADPAVRPGGVLAASPGVAVGSARQFGPVADLDAVLDLPPGDPAAESGRLHDAIDAVRAEIGTLRGQVPADEAAIFDAHLVLLHDPDLVDPALAAIGRGRSARQAWADAVRTAAQRFDALADPYLQARAADVRAVGEQVLAALLGATAVQVRPGVLVARDLSPAQAATLDPAVVSAVVLAAGSATAHSAILLRARGIPAVTGAGPSVLEIPDGTTLALDGGLGELIIDPSGEVRAEFAARSSAATARSSAAAAASHSAAQTRDSATILVGANAGSVDDARAAADAGADLIGLVRTEFLFLGRSSGPSVDEQETVYRDLAEAIGGRRLTLRTLDVGGDKPLPYLPQVPEANPFLGVRGLRLSQAHPDLLADQLLAMVRVAHATPVSLMFPMVTTVDEVVWARRALADAIAREGRGEPAGLRVGIMVEVPAAALKAAALAAYVDFFSIGTNDLTQYALAAERGNDAVAGLADGLDPGVLQLIAATVTGAGDRLVAVCGELAADEQATSLLVGLGVRELSVAPIAVPLVKQAVREVSQPEALAAQALAAPSAAAVRTLFPT